MRIRRLLVAATVTALTAPAATLAISSPASAATATRVVGANGKPWLTSSSYQNQPGVPVYGGTLSLAVNVVTDAGAQVYDGTITVQRKLAGQSTWTTVASATSAYLYDTIKAAGNATYRVTYSGTANYVGSAASASAKVQRKLDLTPTSGRKAGLKGKVLPKYRGPVTILKKQGKKWKPFRTVRTNKQSRFAITLPAPRKGKYFWRVTIKSSKAFATTQSPTYYTRKY